MKLQNEQFEAGDSTGLICVKEGSIRAVVSDQMKLLGFKLQQGLFREDVALRLQTHAYDVLIVAEDFEQTEGDQNRIIMDCCDLSPAHRRSLFVVLIGSDFVSEDGLQAFQRSVDLVVSIADLGNLAPVLRRNLEDHRRQYRPFQECIERALTVS